MKQAQQFIKSEDGFLPALGLIGANLVGKGLAAAAGGLISKGVNRLVNGKQTPQRAGQSLVQLRQDAEAAGFNPLTALKATGGGAAYGAFMPSLGSNESFIGTGPTDINWWNTVRHDREAEKVAAAQQARLAAEESFAHDYTNDFGFVGSSADKSPPSRPGPRSKTIPVYSPDGQLFQMPKSAADRLGITQFSWITPGEWAELRGEIIGEGESMIASGEISEQLGMGFFGPHGPQSRPVVNQAPRFNRNPDPEPGWMQDFFQ